MTADSGSPSDLPIQLPQFLDATTDVVLCCDGPDHRLIYLNPSAVRTFGRSVAEFLGIGSSWISAVHEDDKAILSSLLENPSPSNRSAVTLRIVQPDRTIRWIEARRLSTTAENERSEVTCLIATDVTSQREAHHQLADAHAEYRSLADQLPLSFIRKDASGRRTYVNRQYCEQHGVTADQVLGKSDADLFPPELARKFADDDRRVLERGEVLHDIEEMMGIQGIPRIIDRIKSPIRDENGKIVGVQVLFWDVTDDVAARDALSESEAHYQSLVESLPLSVFRKDSEFHFVFGNQRFCEALGQPVSSFYGKTDFDLFPKDLAEKYRRDDQKIIQTGETFEDIEELIHGDGQRFYIQTFK